MPKKQVSSSKDLYEEEYGEMEVIYISESAQKRLNGDESIGNWHDKCPYSNIPTEKFCYSTTVPKSSLENNFFHPDRFEVDIAAERCERVSNKVIAKHTPKKVQSGPRFKKGMRVQKTFYGTNNYTETDEDVVESVRNGVVRTVDCGSGITFDAVTGKELENYFAGMHKEIVPLGELAKSNSKKTKKKK